MRRSVLFTGGFSLAALLALPLAVLPSSAATPATPALASGIAVGGRTTPFDVTDVTGPNRGRTLCYI